jgi:hypothetical protein
VSSVTETNRLHGPSRYPARPARLPRLDDAPLSRTTYRGFELQRGAFRDGHVNVQTERGFYGGYGTVVEACERVDSIIRGAECVCVRASATELAAAGLPADADAYRVLYLES